MTDQPVDHLKIASDYLAAVDEKLTTQGYRSDAEMRTDVMYGIAHALVDIAQCWRAIFTGPGPATDATEQAPKPPAPAPGAKSKTPGQLGGAASCAAQDADEHTCSLCGRVGTRRFERATADEWWCTDRAACRRRCRESTAKNVSVEHGPPDHRADPAADATSTVGPAAPHSPTPAAADEPLEAPPLPPGVTARCQDCTRTWNLTGRVLEMAVEQHEQKHGHIVDVQESADA